MNAFITYKKIALVIMIVSAMNMNAVLVEKCKPCAAAAAAHAAKINAANAAKLSIQAAHAAMLAAGKPSRESEVDEVDAIQIENAGEEDVRCAACEAVKESLAEALVASLDAMDQIAAMNVESIAD